MTVDDTELDRTGRTRTMRVPRTRGAVSGVLLILLGAWGALAPFIGPYFDYSYGTDSTWTWTAARGWLEVLPGAVTVVGGFLLLVSRHRVSGSTGGWLAALAGAWFVIGQSLASLWHIGSVGEPLSTRDSGRAAAQLGYFYGLGAVIIFLAAFGLGRLAVVGVRDLRVARLEDERAAEQARLAELERQRVAEQEQRDRLAAAEQEQHNRLAAEPVEHRTTTDDEAVTSTYNPDDGHADRHAPAHSADPRPDPANEPSPYDPRA
ncbi:MAG TPA: hypothetical protein VJ851_03335 [Jatrophihabitans sp.]|nr:hypothetical protein [Jatrophihabitans sp.]